MDFKWGFLAAGVGMLIGFSSFCFRSKKIFGSEEGKSIGLPVKN